MKTFSATAKKEQKAVSAGVKIQPKLLVASSGDRYEREADAIAEQIVNSRDQEVSKPPVIKPIFGSYSEGYVDSPNLISQIRRTRGNGRPMQAKTRTFMENAFSTDFSSVKIHTGQQATEMTRSIQAKAFTYGKDIYFNENQYRPESKEGEELLAHELVHVIQQKNCSPQIYRKSLSSAALADQTVEIGTSERLYWRKPNPMANEIPTNDLEVSRSSLQKWIIEQLEKGFKTEKIIGKIKLSEEFTGSAQARDFWANYAIQLLTTDKVSFPESETTTSDEIDKSTGQGLGSNSLYERPITFTSAQAAKLSNKEKSQQVATAKSLNLKSDVLRTSTKGIPANVKTIESITNEDPEYKKVKQKVISNAKSQRKPKETLSVKKDKIIEYSELSSKEKSKLKDHERITAKIKISDSKEIQIQEFEDALKSKIELLVERNNRLPEESDGRSLQKLSNGKDFISKTEARQVGRANEEYYKDPLNDISSKKKSDECENFQQKNHKTLDESVKVKFPQEKVGKILTINNASKAAVKPKNYEEINHDDKIRMLDNVFEENRVPIEWIRDHESKEISDVYEEKVEMQDKLASIPVNYKSKEIPKLNKVKEKVNAAINTDAKSMLGIHKAQEKHLRAMGEIQDKAAQKRLYNNIEGEKLGKKEFLSRLKDINDKVQKKVQCILRKLPTLVGEFEDIVDKANSNFKSRAKHFWGYIYPGATRRIWPYSENEVRREKQIEILREEIQEEKKKYLGGKDLKLSDEEVIIAGWKGKPENAVKRAKRRNADYIFKKLKEHFYNRIFEGKHEFKKNIEYSDNVKSLAPKFVNVINEAKKVIHEGKKELKDLLERKPEGDEEVETAVQNLKSVFKTLESAVEDQKDEIINEMASYYVTTEKELKQEYEEIGKKVIAENKKGLFSRVYNKVKNVIVTIYNFGEVLVDLIGELFSNIGGIVMHPIRFFETLTKGIVTGINSFIDNIGENIGAAFFQWLKGVGKGREIVLPQNAKSGISIFSFVTQLLDLNAETFWERVKAKFPKLYPKIIDVYNKGAAFVEKGLEIFTIIQEEGIMGIWNYIKNTAESLINVALNSIKQSVLFKFIEKALFKIMALFNPISGVVEAIKSIISVVQFIVKAMKVVEKIIKAIIDSFQYAVEGIAEPIAEELVKTFRNLIVISIELLVKFLNLGDIRGKAIRSIEKIRKPIINGIDIALDWIRPLVNKIFGGKKKNEEEGLLKDKEVGETIPFVADGESHKLWINTSGPGVKVMVSSDNPMTVGQKLDEWEGKAGYLDDKNRSKEAKEKINVATTQYRKMLKDAAKVEDLINETMNGAASEQAISVAQKADDRLEIAEENLSLTLKQLFEIFEETESEGFLKNTKPVFGPKRHGFGSFVRVNHLAKVPGFIEGTKADSNLFNSNYEILNQRLSSQRGRRYYVRGHLLSQELGGSGKNWENLTPLEQNKNQEHELKFERKLKKIVNEDKQQILDFKVRVTYGRSRSPLLNQVDNIDEETFIQRGINEPEELKLLLEAEESVPTKLVCNATFQEKVDSQPKKMPPVIIDQGNDYIGFNDINKYQLGEITGRRIKTRVNLVQIYHDSGRNKERYIREVINKIQYIPEDKAEKISDLFETIKGQGQVKQYKKILGITKEKWESKNPNLKIIGVLN